VNVPTPYEQLIAAKLDQVPVPDMSDSIWADIEMQLDAAADVPAKKVSLKYKVWFGVAAAAVVAALLWWYFAHKDHAPETPKPPAAAPVTNEPPAVRDSSISISPTKDPVIPRKIKKAASALPLDSVRIDSAAATPVLPPVKVDSLQKHKVDIPDVDLYMAPVQPPPPRGRKPRGVKGITDDDYKLSAQKDSARKKD